MNFAAMSPEPQPSSTTRFSARKGFSSSGVIATRKRSDMLERLAIHSSMPARSGWPYRPCSQANSFASQNCFGSTTMPLNSPFATAAPSVVEARLDPCPNGIGRQRSRLDRGVEIERPLSLRQVGSQHEALIEQAVECKTHLPGANSLTPRLTATWRLVRETAQHVAGQAGLDRSPGVGRQDQSGAPNSLELLIVSIERRRIDAPAQPPAALNLALLGGYEQFDAAFRHRGQEQVASRGTNLLSADARNSFWVTAKLVDLLEKGTQADAGVGIG